MWQVYYRVRHLLQSAAEIITKCGSYYKVRQLLHNAAVHLGRLDAKKDAVWTPISSTFCREKI